MTLITRRIRIGRTHDGDLHIEVWTPNYDHLDADFEQIMIPGDSIGNLMDYLISSQPPDPKP